MRAHHDVMIRRIGEDARVRAICNVCTPPRAINGLHTNGSALKYIMTTTTFQRIRQYMEG